MDSSTTAIVAGAGAAILASGLTGLTTFRATRETLEHNSSALATQLTGERNAAREDREQDRRQEAYVSLLKYVFWLSNVIDISRRVIARQHAAVSKFRQDDSSPRTSAAADAERAAFVDAGPTGEEQRGLDAGPTSEDNATTYALVTALASDEVLRLFEELVKRDRAFSSRQRDVEAALLPSRRRSRQQSPAGLTPTKSLGLRMPPGTSSMLRRGYSMPSTKWLMPGKILKTQLRR